MRDTKYPPKRLAQFLELLARGVPETRASAAIGSSPQTIFWLTKTRPAFASAYAVAKQRGAHLDLPQGRPLKTWEAMLSPPESQAA